MRGSGSFLGTMWVDPGGVSGLCVAYVDLERLRAGGASWEAVEEWSAVNVHGSDNQQLDEIDEAFQDMRDRVLALNGLGLGLERRTVAVMESRSRSWRGFVTVGCEDFVVRQFNASRDFLKPVRLTAALERMWFKAGLGEPVAGGGSEASRVFRQSPGDAMGAVTNDRLKAWGFWTKGREGEDHARDATRHMLLHVRKIASGAVRL